MGTDVIINRDALYALRELPSESVNCCVTSPPYYGLRDYGLAAKSLDRHYIGIELNAEYCTLTGARIGGDNT